MAGPQENMVLRTIYLPKALDRELRELAFSMDKTKGELMRELVLEALAARVGRSDPLTTGAVSITRQMRFPMSACSHTTSLTRCQSPRVKL